MATNPPSFAARGFRLLTVTLAAAALGGAFLILNRPESAAIEQATDDAYVRADFTVIAPQVSGVIGRVAVHDHQYVPAGAALVEIDARGLRLALASAQALVESLRAQSARQDSAIAQARAALAASLARRELAEVNLERFTNLARDGSGTVQARQQAQAEWDIQRAASERDRAGLRAAEQQHAVLRADIAKAQAARADAELHLSYARITAPVAGTVAQRRARAGSYVRAGEPLLTLVPLDALYIEANFRETQLARVRVGQAVQIEVDALPGVQLRGRVQSLGPASGASFSPVPPQNATGNFTKIVQRLPVRIEIAPGQDDATRLRVGMSVRPRISLEGALGL
ncbi:HlyD family secretion protein [uncultured Hydrogenophaga sp.]|uniref:HlyD family secretion protein n=1 Tax=uncultured Hydrogenophaga sp. TaxID=199683 RepID=UPI00258ED168|nr:HlyD family secretion protein [uncultured Hydrogenophaga sp.]